MQDGFVKLIKTDKNGTRYFADTRCQRCGGAGERSEWYYTGMICYACGGTGIARKPQMYKVYAAEYQAKLDERREAKLAKERAENGTDREEERKANEAIMEKLANAEHEARKKELETVFASVSDYVGAVGEKVSFTGELSNAVSFKACDPFGRPETRHVYTFRDNSGNAFTWFTSSGKYMDNEGQKAMVTGTIKGFKEYNGEKQTNLLRVKAIFA